jgi:hypothetical protein
MRVKMLEGNNATIGVPASSSDARFLLCGPHEEYVCTTYRGFLIQGDVKSGFWEARRYAQAPQPIV